MRGAVLSYKLADGSRRWRTRYDLPPGPDGHRRQGGERGFTSKAAAERALRVALSRVDVGTHVEPSRITVADYLRGWVEGVQVRPTTRSRYRQAIEQAIPHVGGVKVQQLTTLHLDAAYRALEQTGGRHGQGLSPKSVRHVHTTIRTALEAAVARGLVPRNVADHASPPKLSRPQMRTWTAEQVARFLRHVEGDRLHAMWVVFATTGMRRGEVLGLRWTDVDLERGRLAVTNVLTRSDGRTIVTEPKTRRSRRTLSLDATTVTALGAWRRRQLEERLAAGPAWADTGYVFTWEDGRFLSPNLPTKWIRQHADAAGLPRIRLHDLRHTWASLALASGVHPKVVSERLGHASVAITLDVYSHATQGLDAEAADTVASAIFGPSGGV